MVNKASIIKVEKSFTSLQLNWKPFGGEIKHQQQYPLAATTDIKTIIKNEINDVVCLLEDQF